MATTATTTTHPAAEREAKAEGGGAKLPSTTASTRIVPALELNLRALEDRLSRREPLDVKYVHSVSSSWPHATRRHRTTTC